MKKHFDPEIPNSRIRQISINVDQNSFSDEGRLLLADPNFFLIGNGNTPYMLYATPDFRRQDLKEDLMENICSVRRMLLNPHMAPDVRSLGEYGSLPKWLKEFTKLEWLRLENFRLDELHYLRDMKLQHLEIVNVKFNDENKLISDIRNLKQLEEISYDDSFPEELLRSLRKSKLKLTQITDEL